MSELELCESVVAVKDESILPRLEKQHPLFRHPKWAQLPELYFKWGVGGYELGLEVQADWWKQTCGNGELSKIKSDPDYLCGTTRLVIATLPYSEFGFYYEDAPYNKIQKVQEAIDKQLEGNGWKRKDIGGSEIQDPWSHVEHKYFTVSHRGI